MALIARLFSDHATADRALAELRTEGEDFGSEIITAPPASAAPAEPGDDPLGLRLRRAGIASSHATIYAEHLHRGAILLVTHPLFMHGQRVEDILASYHPLSVDLPLLEALPTESERLAAPLSARFGWPVLLSDPAPLSRRLGWPTLIRQPALPRSESAVARQSREAAPLSRAVGLPTLSANPAPLSSAVKWRPLLDKAAPLSDRLKWRTLLPEPAPLSKRIGWRELLKDPAPLSSLLGLPVLTKRQ